MPDVLRLRETHLVHVRGQRSRGIKSGASGAASGHSPPCPLIKLTILVPSQHTLANVCKACSGWLPDLLKLFTLKKVRCCERSSMKFNETFGPSPLRPFRSGPCRTRSSITSACLAAWQVLPRLADCLAWNEYKEDVPKPQESRAGRLLRLIGKLRSPLAMLNGGVDLQLTRHLKVA